MRRPRRLVDMGVFDNVPPIDSFTEKCLFVLTFLAISLSVIYIFLILGEPWPTAIQEAEYLRLKGKPVLFLLLGCFQLIQFFSFSPSFRDNLVIVVPLANIIIYGMYFIEYNLSLNLPYVEFIINTIEALWKQTLYVLLICGMEIFAQLFAFRR